MNSFTLAIIRVNDAPASRNSIALERASGFVDKQVFKAGGSSCLVTRWSDAASFERWLNQSGSIEVLLVLRDLVDPRPALTADYPKFFDEYLKRSSVLHFIAAELNGNIRAMTPNVAEKMKVANDALLGKPLWDCLVSTDARLLREVLSRKERTDPLELMLNFIDRKNSPYTLKCLISITANGFILIGEEYVHAEQRLQQDLLSLNAELATAVRDHFYQNKLLGHAIEQLESALGHVNKVFAGLKGVLEPLPVCMVCGKLRVAEDWVEIPIPTGFPHLLTHGYCPHCLEVAQERLREEQSNKTRSSD